MPREGGGPDGAHAGTCQGDDLHSRSSSKRDVALYAGGIHCGLRRPVGPAGRVSLPAVRRHDRRERAGRVTAVLLSGGFLGTHGIRGCPGVFGAFTGLVFIGAIKAGGQVVRRFPSRPVSTQAAPHGGSGTGMEISERPESRRGTCLAGGWRSAQWFMRNPRRGRPAAHGHPEPADLRASDGAFGRADTIHSRRSVTSLRG